MLLHAKAPPPARFASAGAVIARAAAALRPEQKEPVSVWAERFRILKTPGGYSGPWQNAETPFLVEPMDRMTSRAVELWVMVGPSQFGKTQCFLNYCGHAAMRRPGDVLLMQPSQGLAEDFAERQLSERLIEAAPELLRLLGHGRGDDTATTKVFANGTRIECVWPTAKNLASKTVKTFLIDERDRIADDIGGEGDPVGLAQNRVKIFGAEGLVAVASSPSREDRSGIVELFGRGDGNLWHWPCVHCGEFFTPGFDAERNPTVEHLYIRPDAEPEEARAEAVLNCPACGSDIEERKKAGLNSRGLWLPRGCTIDAAGRISGTRPAGRVVSYWFSGLASPFERWGKLAHDLVTARRGLEAGGDDAKLRAVLNTGFGVPYRRVDEDLEPLESKTLEQRREDYDLGTVPPGVRFLTAAVDVQGDRFEVEVKGHGDKYESWIVDRFALRQMPDGKTDISPGRYAEHWGVLLERVFAARYPLASTFVDDKPLYLPVAGVAIDTGGVPGVAENAKEFWRVAVAGGVAKWQISLIKGASVAGAPIWRPPTYETDKAGKERRNGPALYVIGVSKLKDIVAARLRREDPGPGFIHLPRDLADRHIAELVAEEKVDGEWIRRGANETFDLEGYNLFQAMRLKPNRVDWKNPPDWARPSAKGDEAAAPASTEQNEQQANKPAAPPTAIGPAAAALGGAQTGAQGRVCKRLYGKGLAWRQIFRRASRSSSSPATLGSGAARISATGRPRAGRWFIISTAPAALSVSRRRPTA